MKLACSIVMATYNKADLLDLSLASIRQQRPPFDYEIIVVDDGSTDSTSEVCKRYGVRYRYLDRPYYCNSAAPHNVGLRMARADVVIQQCEVVHETENAIEKLTLRAQPRMMDFASIYNASLDNNGISSPGWMPLCRLSPDVAYSGPQNPRPLFFLGAAMREDLFAVGGHDEDFTKSGYEDNWLAICMIRGQGCECRHWADVLGYHLDHPRPGSLFADQEEMRLVYEAKVRTGVFCASGGPWSVVPFADIEEMTT